MPKFIIEGGTPLTGTIRVSGNKNAALPIIAATVLTDEQCVITNVPAIRDVDSMLAILQDLGKSVERPQHDVVYIRGDIKKNELDAELGRKLRASILYLGVILARTGEATIFPPGGCVIGRRSVGTHFESLAALGAKIYIQASNYHATLSNKATPTTVFLTEASVTATANTMFLAASLPYETTIENAACEPHITDLAMVLQKMGAHIKGDGSNHLVMRGEKKLHGFEHSIVADHIEAGTFAVAAACTQGHLTIEEANIEHLRTTCRYLKNMGINLTFVDNTTLVVKPSQLCASSNKIQVGTWPGFPTDLMSPMIVLATQSQGTTLCHDWMYESRMFFVDKLIDMGAQITLCDPHRVLVSGPSELKAQELSSPDLRAGIALVIAALTAKGKSEIDKVELIDRGYEKIAARLQALNAKIERHD